MNTVHFLITFFSNLSRVILQKCMGSPKCCTNANGLIYGADEVRLNMTAITFNSDVDLSYRATTLTLDHLDQTKFLSAIRCVHAIFMFTEV